MIEVLIKAGLRENEAQVYVTLLQLGTTHASRVISEVKLPKSSVYNALEYLLERGLVHKYIHEGTSKYSPEDPQKLDFMLHKKIQETKRDHEELKTILPELYGYINPDLHLPKVRMYQGEEGIRTVLNDTLEATEIIYAYVSIEDMEKYGKVINDKYVQKRVQKNIQKYALVENTQYAKNFLRTYIGMKTSSVRFLPEGMTPFHIEMNIYDNKVSYITYRDDKPVGIIIEDPDIYRIHRSTFEMTWEQAKEIF